MQPSMLLVVARAEMRTSRRLVRYWLYAALAVIIGVGTYVQFATLHAGFSGMSATVAMVGPRYLIAQSGFNLLIIFLTGVTFLAFDVRSRDERDRMVDVLDSRAVTNAEFVIGRVLALVLIAWLPLLVVGALYELVGVVSGVLDLPGGDAVEPLSVLGFLLRIFAGLFLWCSLIAVLVAVVRYRILIAVISLALIALQIWTAFSLPLHVQQWVSLMPPFVLASDIIPRPFAEGDGLRILSHLILGAGLLCLATALYPRRDGTSSRTMIAASLAIVAASMAVLGTSAWQEQRRLQRGVDRLAVHAERQSSPRADMKTLSGTLVLEPGDQVAMDLEIEVAAPAAGALLTLLFTLNPGIVVTDITIDDVKRSWTQGDGLLEIELPAPIAPGTSTRIALRAAGEPDSSFGYLDTPVDRMARQLTQAQISILGIKPSVFDARYVAMMPSAHWLPSTGAGAPTGDPRTHPSDYFMLDLMVEIPEDWLVAGPGRRQLEDTDGDSSHYRFRPSSPVPHVGLLASRFVRRAAEIAGIEFEILLYPDHDRNLGFFADAEDVIRERIGILFTSAAELGLRYPYDGLSLVETPNELRGYGGGWRMDSVQSMPGVMMLRENSFPTARFESRFTDLTELVHREDGVGGAKADAIEQFFGKRLTNSI